MSRRILMVTVQPSGCAGEKIMLAWFFERAVRWAERPFMRKTAAVAAVSTQCGFPNGAGWTVTNNGNSSAIRKEAAPVLRFQPVRSLFHVVWQFCFNLFYFVLFLFLPESRSADAAAAYTASRWLSHVCAGLYTVRTAFPARYNALCSVRVFSIRCVLLMR